MRAQLVTMDLVGLALKGLYKLSCVAILYFLADAVFYHGDWWDVAYAALVAGVMYYVSMAYDMAFAEFVRKYGGDIEEAAAQQEFKFTVTPKRRTNSLASTQSGKPRPTINGYVRSANY